MSIAARRLSEAADLEQYAPDIDMQLDRGIRRYVLIFRRAGIETIESCEGGHGHSFPEPTIRFGGNSGEGYKAISVAMTYGLPVLALRRTWDVVDGELTGPWWEITFRTKEPIIAAIENNAS
jgi:hypothetical protein